MVSERYSRQLAIQGWQQEKLTKSRVCVVGNGRLSDFITVDLIALGFGAVTRIGKTNFFDFEKINPEIKIEQVDSDFLPELTEIYFPEGDFLIGAGNDFERKVFSCEYAKDRKINYVSASASEKGFLFSLENDLIRATNFHSEDYREKIEGNLNSIVCSAMVVDEIRKRIFPLKYDILTNEFFYKGIDDNCQNLKDKKIMVVGAGGTGTFAGMGLALEGSFATIFDFDSVEESNLNRQILFFDSIGKNKAIALEEKLKRYSRDIHSKAKKINENFYFEDCHGIICCVDNFSARRSLNRIASRDSIPLINCGISLYEADAMSYIPGQTACLDCQMNGLLTEGVKSEEEKSGSCVVYPNLIIPNQIAGALAIDRLKKVFLNQSGILRYSSGEGIFEEKPKNKCLERCELKYG